MSGPGRFRCHLPEPVPCPSGTFGIQGPGTWLVLSDVHLPFHERAVVEAAVAKARRVGVAGVLLNGDVLDSHSLSRFDRSPDDPRYVQEIEAGRALLAYLRERLPKARIVWKDGNHEERLYSYLVRKAPELFGLEALTLPSLLGFRDHGVEYVTDRRVIELGKLHVIHGHEYRPGIMTPVNPARGLFLRAKSVALTSHFHQTSEHHEPTIALKPQGAWSVGCACNLQPQYMPLNRWNWGFATVEVANSGEFSVQNLRVLDGKIV